MGKRVLLAAPRGYCAGVDRAVVAVEKSLELYGAPVYVRKEIVHNKHVVSTLEQRGVIFVNETDEVPEGATVVFSAHGVSPAVHAEAAARNLKTIDATCPLVTKVHNEVKRFANEETEILLIGHIGHEEVEGTAGEAPGKVRVVDGLDEARTIQPTPGKKLVWLTQTTLSVDETMQSVAILQERFPEIANPPSDDICYATQHRQEAIKAIAPQADLVLVVGSRNSSNSVRLVEVALEYGAKAAYLIDYADEVKEEWLVSAETIGVTSGASVPEILVDDLLKHLSSHGYHDVEEVRATVETLLFALPKELRADLKKA
jgi:4-hydroxy-3-methylbut-2-enyl diphosphate reductase